MEIDCFSLFPPGFFFPPVKNLPPWASFSLVWGKESDGIVQSSINRQFKPDLYISRTSTLRTMCSLYYAQIPTFDMNWQVFTMACHKLNFIHSFIAARAGLNRESYMKDFFFRHLISPFLHGSNFTPKEESNKLWLVCQI